MEKPRLTEEDFQSAAAKLRCDVAAIKAVAEVESKGKAFYADSFPTILFERHKFHKFTKGKFDKSHPEISNPEAGGYGAAGQHQRDKFNLAFSLDPVAALKSCSWGRFQIMGFNYELCGFESVGAFVDAMKESEGAQLAAFVKFVIETGLSDELRNHKWTALAEGYNGLNQKKNNYDKKLAAAYRKFTNPAAKAPANLINTSQNPAGNPSVIPASEPADAPPDDSGNSPDSTDGTVGVETQKICKERPSTFVRWFVSIKTFIGAVITGIGTYVGFDDVKAILIEKGGNLDARAMELIMLMLVKTSVIVGAGVFLMWIASKLYDKAANRANSLNLQKLVGAQDKNKLTTDFGG